MTKQNKINTAYVVVGCYRLEGEEGGGGRKGGCGLGGEKQGMAQAAARQRRGEGEGCSEEGKRLAAGAGAEAVAKERKRGGREIRRRTHAIHRKETVMSQEQIRLGYIVKLHFFSAGIQR